MVRTGADAALKTNYITDDPYAREMLRLDVRAALQAIAPMVEKLLEEQREKIASAIEDLNREDYRYDEFGVGTYAAAKLLREWGFKG